ncbi:galactose mutarotase [Olivibacter ginsenosidimutans]|uniref:Aldose 1-epimerase n=1 Tax=Olivibacter ginsenosidimutans TaxID=1176537 RepID=A0ABP9AIX9_9SPHI
MMRQDKLPLLEDFKAKIGDKSTALIILKNSRGMQVALTNFGARIVSIIVPDKSGNPTDVVLGFNTISQYLEADEIYHGTTVGRYANRIAGGSFSLNGKTYHIEPNNGSNALHGGKNGFHQHIWDRRLHNPTGVTFYYNSPDGEEGFPGNLNTSVDYFLTEDNELKIHYRATTDQDTIVNLTNHAYFNLNGEGAGEVLDHFIQINAETFLPINGQHVPTGEVATVENTPFDFRQSRLLSSTIHDQEQQLLHGEGGYDHTFVLALQKRYEPVLVASAYATQSGIKLDVSTTEPGVQFYTGNALSGKDKGKSGNAYAKQHAFCFETQHFPNAPNQPEFPSTILKAGHTYRSQTIYRFNVIK